MHAWTCDQSGVFRTQDVAGALGTLKCAADCFFTDLGFNTRAVLVARREPAPFNASFERDRRWRMPKFCEYTSRLGKRRGDPLQVRTLNCVDGVEA